MPGGCVQQPTINVSLAWAGDENANLANELISEIKRSEIGLWKPLLLWRDYDLEPLRRLSEAFRLPLQDEARWRAVERFPAGFGSAASRHYRKSSFQIRSLSSVGCTYFLIMILFSSFLSQLFSSDVIVLL